MTTGRINQVTIPSKETPPSTTQQTLSPFCSSIKKYHLHFDQAQSEHLLGTRDTLPACLLRGITPSLRSSLEFHSPWSNTRGGSTTSCQLSSTMPTLTSLPCSLDLTHLRKVSPCLEDIDPFPSMRTTSNQNHRTECDVPQSRRILEWLTVLRSSHQQLIHILRSLLTCSITELSDWIRLQAFMPANHPAFPPYQSVHPDDTGTSMTGFRRSQS